MNRLAIILLSIIAFVTVAMGQPLPTARIDSFLNILEARELAMGSLTISRNGHIVYQKAMGYRCMDLGRKIPATIATGYRIGSASKMFTAVMVFQLIEEGKLSLDQKLATFFPQLPNAGKITIGQMLSHRSGLHDYTHDTDFPAWMDKPTTHKELLQIIQDKGSDFEPGTEADYSNSNYLLLGYIIEQVCKMPYALALKTRISKRLHLQNTSIGNNDDKNKYETCSYKFSGGNWQAQKKTDLGIHGGAGSIASTPADMVKFIDALFSNQLITPASLAQMKTMQDDYGMGMFPNKYGDRASFGHNGRIEEFYSALWHFPGEKLSIAYCTNGINFPRTDLIEGVLKICFDEPYEIPFAQTRLQTSEDLDQYTGKYANDQIAVTCTREGTQLVVETQGKPFPLEQISSHLFMNKASGYYFEFFPGSAILKIKETDNTYRLKRVIDNSQQK